MAKKPSYGTMRQGVHVRGVSTAEGVESAAFRKGFFDKKRGIWDGDAWTGQAMIYEYGRFAAMRCDGPPTVGGRANPEVVAAVNRIIENGDVPLPQWQKK